jgi:hypothetical protein
MHGALRAPRGRLEGRSDFEAGASGVTPQRRRRGVRTEQTVE